MTNTKGKTLAVLFSGGDAPGMNQFLRAFVRLMCNRHGASVLGVRDGYSGLVRSCRRVQKGELTSHQLAGSIINFRYGRQGWDHDLAWLDSHSVSGLAHRGGVVLGSSRCPEFKDPLARRQVIDLLDELRVDTVVVCGGDGSLTGAGHLAQESSFQVIGVPASIDNDLPMTEMALGFDTAINTVTECARRFNDTAASHHRIMVLEIMGRNCGNLAIHSALASGAEIVVTPERGLLDKAKMLGIAQRLSQLMAGDRAHAVVLVAEGVKSESGVPSSTAATSLATFLTEYFRDQPAPINLVETRASVLGHLQRGGAPMAYDQILAARFAEAGELTVSSSNAESGIVGLRQGTVVLSGFSADLSDEAANSNRDLYQLQKDITK